MEDLVVELLGEKDNCWHGTVRQALEKWTAKEWRKVYGFAREGEGMASRTDRFINGKFSSRVNPKDGYVVVDCKEPRTRKVLEFLVPLLYPEKPTKHYIQNFRSFGLSQNNIVNCDTNTYVFFVHDLG